MLKRVSLFEFTFLLIAGFAVKFGRPQPLPANLNRLLTTPSSSHFLTINGHQYWCSPTGGGRKRCCLPNFWQLPPNKRCLNLIQGSRTIGGGPNSAEVPIPNAIQQQKAGGANHFSQEVLAGFPPSSNNPLGGPLLPVVSPGIREGSLTGPSPSPPGTVPRRSVNVNVPNPSAHSPHHSSLHHRPPVRPPGIQPVNRRRRRPLPNNGPSISNSLPNRRLQPAGPELAAAAASFERTDVIRFPSSTSSYQQQTVVAGSEGFQNVARVGRQNHHRNPNRSQFEQRPYAKVEWTSNSPNRKNANTAIRRKPAALRPPALPPHKRPLNRKKQTAPSIIKPVGFNPSVNSGRLHHFPAPSQSSNFRAFQYVNGVGPNDQNILKGLPEPRSFAPLPETGPFLKRFPIPSVGQNQQESSIGINNNADLQQRSNPQLLSIQNGLKRANQAVPAEQRGFQSPPKLPRTPSFAVPKLKSSPQQRVTKELQQSPAEASEEGRVPGEVHRPPSGHFPPVTRKNLRNLRLQRKSKPTDETSISEPKPSPENILPKHLQEIKRLVTTPATPQLTKLKRYTTRGPIIDHKGLQRKRIRSFIKSKAIPEPEIATYDYSAEQELYSEAELAPPEPEPEPLKPVSPFTHPEPQPAEEEPQPPKLSSADFLRDKLRPKLSNPVVISKENQPKFSYEELNPREIPVPPEPRPQPEPITQQPNHLKIPKLPQRFRKVPEFEELKPARFSADQYRNELSKSLGGLHNNAAVGRRVVEPVHSASRPSRIQPLGHEEFAHGIPPYKPDASTHPDPELPGPLVAFAQPKAAEGKAIQEPPYRIPPKVQRSLKTIPPTTATTTDMSRTWTTTTPPSLSPKPASHVNGSYGLNLLKQYPKFVSKMKKRPRPKTDMIPPLRTRKHKQRQQKRTMAAAKPPPHYRQIPPLYSPKITANNENIQEAKERLPTPIPFFSHPFQLPPAAPSPPSPPPQTTTTTTATKSTSTTQQQTSTSPTTTTSSSSSPSPTTAEKLVTTTKTASRTTTYTTTAVLSSSSVVSKVLPVTTTEPLPSPTSSVSISSTGTTAGPTSTKATTSAPLATEQPTTTPTKGTRKPSFIKSVSQEDPDNLILTAEDRSGKGKVPDIWPPVEHRVLPGRLPCHRPWGCNAKLTKSKPRKHSKSSSTTTTVPNVSKALEHVMPMETPKVSPTTVLTTSRKPTSVRSTSTTSSTKIESSTLTTPIISSTSLRPPLTRLNPFISFRSRRPFFRLRTPYTRRSFGFTLGSGIGWTRWWSTSSTAAAADTAQVTTTPSSTKIIKTNMSNKSPAAPNKSMLSDSKGSSEDTTVVPSWFPANLLSPFAFLRYLNRLRSQETVSEDRIRAEFERFRQATRDWRASKSGSMPKNLEKAFEAFAASSSSSAVGKTSVKSRKETSEKAKPKKGGNKPLKKSMKIDETNSEKMTTRSPPSNRKLRKWTRKKPVIGKKRGRKPLKKTQKPVNAPKPIKKVDQKTLSKQYFNGANNLQQKNVNNNHYSVVASSYEGPISKCKLDLLFMVDASGSVKQRFSTELQLAAAIVDRLDVRKERSDESPARVGLIRFAGRRKALKVFSFKDYDTKAAMQSAIVNTKHLSGTTDIAEALTLAASEFTADQGSRMSDAGVRKVTIIFTDGYSRTDPGPSAKLLQRKGITVYTVTPQGTPSASKDLLQIAGHSNRVINQSDQFDQMLTELTKNCENS